MDEFTEDEIISKIAPKSDIGSNENEVVCENVGTTFEFTSAGVFLGSVTYQEKTTKMLSFQFQKTPCLPSSKEVFVQGQEAFSNAFYRPLGEKKVEQQVGDLMYVVVTYQQKQKHGDEIKFRRAKRSGRPTGNKSPN